jgi:hypothetical protein
MRGRSSSGPSEAGREPARTAEREARARLSSGELEVARVLLGRSAIAREVMRRAVPGLFIEHAIERINEVSLDVCGELAIVEAESGTAWEINGEAVEAWRWLVR